MVAVTGAMAAAMDATAAAMAEVGDAMAVLDTAVMVAMDVMADVTVTAMAAPM